MKGKVLIIAGSDSGGGAGIQGDIKTVTALGGYAATAITALTAQNTRGVFGIMDVPEEFISKQIELALSDIGADIIKTGMLHKIEVIKAVVKSLNKSGKNIPLVVDPVMVAKGGEKLLEEKALAYLKSSLIARAALVTPNIPEAEILSGMKIKTVEDMIAAGEKILNLGVQAVLVKGGHLSGGKIKNVLVTEKTFEIWKTKRYKTKHTHGTGCTLASAIATYLAQGKPLKKSIQKAIEYVDLAIRKAPKIGHGHGPLNHLPFD